MSNSNPKKTKIDPSKKPSSKDIKPSKEPKSQPNKTSKNDNPKSKPHRHLPSDDDDYDKPKKESKPAKGMKASKPKNTKNDKSDDDVNTNKNYDDDSDDDYDDPGYEFNNTESDSESYSDSDSYDEESSDANDIDDITDRDSKPRSTRSHKRRHKTRLQKPNHRPHTYSKLPSSFSSGKPQSCDSDIATDPSTQKGRKRIAKKTLQIISYGPNMGKYSVRRRNGTIEYVNIREQISNSYKHSVTLPKNYYKDDQMKPNAHIRPRDRMCKFDVLPVATFCAAKHLVKKDHLKTCVLNYASATKPGGGFLHGRQAQEESLSRQSALYVTIMNSQMYKDNLNSDDDLYNDYMIYSSRVPVFRSSFREHLLRQSEVFETSVITSAAPNLHNINKKGALLKDFILWWKQYKPKVLRRCRKIILLAIEKGTEALVLGAYGCGVFENSPRKISKIYRKLLIDEGLGKYFVKVVFAIIDRNSENFKAFYEQFKKA